MFVIVLMFVGMYPTILEQADKLESLVEVYPEAFLQAFGIEDFRFDTIEKFLGVEYYSIFWPIAMIVLVIGLAGSVIAREIENGTIEYTLAKPIGRQKIFISKYIGGFLVVATFTFISVYSIVPTATIAGIDYNAAAQFAVFGLAMLASLAVYSLAMMFSAIFSEKGMVSLVMGMIMIVMYIVNIASKLIHQVEWLQYTSFFYYFDYDMALTEGVINTASVFIFAEVIIITVIIGSLWFEKRDIST
jgi:ABC-2 type transport system permease protein